nr:calcium/sodium antiporter [Kofleriaceae bacterium]
MAIAFDVVQLVLGIAVLYWGAAWLLRGSATVARALGVKPLVVGLIVVAYGSSAPELAVSTETALAHAQPIALGTVIGSCCANISLILGITALISPPQIDRRVIRRELPILVGSAIAVPLLLRNGVLSRLEGLVLLVSAFVFTVVSLLISWRLEEQVGGDDDGDDAPARERSDASLGGRGRPRRSPIVAFGAALAGIVLLLAGSQLLVRGGRGFAAETEMSERMLGLTIMALGTALPELVAAIALAVRGKASVAASSVIGANLLSVFLVLGVTACLSPIRLGERMHLVDLIGLVAITMLGALMLRGSRRISRAEGVVLIAAYVGFIVCAAVF